MGQKWVAQVKFQVIKKSFDPFSLLFPQKQFFFIYTSTPARAQLWPGDPNMGGGKGICQQLFIGDQVLSYGR